MVSFTRKRITPLIDLSALLIALWVGASVAKYSLNWLWYAGVAAGWLVVFPRPRSPWVPVGFATTVCTLILVVSKAPRLIFVFVPIFLSFVLLHRLSFLGPIYFSKSLNLFRAPWIRIYKAISETGGKLSQFLSGLPWEYFRLSGIAGAALWLCKPYFTNCLVGSGDGQWYASVLADYITQRRAGVFPVWVGQSYLAFYGSTFPLRFAPYFQHFADAIDLISGRHLNAFALQNATIILSTLGGGLSCYWSLVVVSPRLRWCALGLSFLYISCPGVLGLVYSQDMLMSYMSLPYPPIVFAGIVASFRNNTFLPRAAIAAGLAMTWLCHSPIGMWVTILAALSQFIRLLCRWQGVRGVCLDFCAGLLWIVLGSYPFVSVATLGTRVAGGASFGGILMFVKRSFPDSLLPLDATKPLLTHLQLGYGLWLIAGLFLYFVWRYRRAESVTLAIFVALLVCLLFPIPFLNEILWSHMPDLVVQITNFWPMQRLYLPLALCIIFGFTLVMGYILQDAPSRGARISFYAILTLVCFWQGIVSSSFFFKRGDFTTVSEASSATLFLPENLSLTKSALGQTPVPPRYFSHGVMDAEAETRLLDPSGTRILTSNLGDVFPEYGPNSQTEPKLPLPLSFGGEVDANPGILNLTPRIILSPGVKYFLVFHFSDKKYEGVLQLIGKDFFREYLLPESGNAFAFGSNRANSRAIPLMTSLSEQTEVLIRFIPTKVGEKPADYNSFASYSLVRADDPDRRIQVSSLVPFRATVGAPSDALMETPRLYIPGWQAVVNGRIVATKPSDDYLVSFPIPRGTSNIELHYVAPFSLKLSYTATWISWFGFCIWAIIEAMRHRRAIAARPKLEAI